MSDGVLATEAIVSVTYVASDVVMALDVEWSQRGRRREVVLARLSEEAIRNYQRAVEEVAPFVAAIKRGDGRAVREVCRALYAARDARHAPRANSDGAPSPRNPYAEACRYDPAVVA